MQYAIYYYKWFIEVHEEKLSNMKYIDYVKMYDWKDVILGAWVVQTYIYMS